MNTTDIADRIPGRGRAPARRRVAATVACTLAVLTAVAGCGSATPTLASATPTATLSAAPPSSAATSADATVPAGPSASVGTDGSSEPRAQAGSVAPGGPVPAGPAAPPGPVVTTGGGGRSGSAPQAAKTTNPPQAGGGSSVARQPPVKPHTVAPQPPRGGVGSPAGGNGSGPALASPIRVPLPTDSISSQPFETARSFLEPQIRTACGDDSLCVHVAAKADPEAGPGQDCVGSAENTDSDGSGAGTVTVPRGGTIFLLIDAFCAEQPVALARTDVDHFS